jgi:hypothetical protein
MATPARKQPGSPIGRAGPRKTHLKYKRRVGEPWEWSEIRELKSLAKCNAPTGVISLKLGRPPAAIRSKAQREGISLIGDGLGYDIASYEADRHVRFDGN